MSIFDRLVAAVTPPESEAKRAEARAKASAAASPGDWLSLILDHHKQIEAAFAGARNPSSASEGRAALKRLGELLNGHSMAEEAVIYPAVADAGRKAHAEMAYAEQVAAKMQLAALEKLDPLSDDYADKLGHLEDAVAHHVYKEESDWFIDLKERASPADQQKLLDRYSEEFNRYMRGGEISSRSAADLSEPRSFEARPDA